VEPATTDLGQEYAGQAGGVDARHDEQVTHPRASR
jgi:hypothetical protein